MKLNKWFTNQSSQHQAHKPAVSWFIKHYIASKLSASTTGACARAHTQLLLISTPLRFKRSSRHSSSHTTSNTHTHAAGGQAHTRTQLLLLLHCLGSNRKPHTRLEHTRRPVSDRLSATRAQAEKSTAFLFQSTRHPLGQLGQHQRKQEANLRPLPLSTTNSTKGSCCSLQQHQYRHNKLATLPGRPSPVAAAAVVWTHGPGFT